MHINLTKALERLTKWKKGNRVLVRKDNNRKCFLFLCILTIRGNNREWGVLPSAAGQEWTSHHSCCGGKKAQNKQTLQAGESDGLLKWSAPRDAPLLCTLSFAAARGESFDLRTGCWDALKVTEVLISSTAFNEFTQRHERYAVRAFTLCMLFLPWHASIKLFLYVLLSSSFVVRDAQLADITVIACRSCGIVEVVLFCFSVYTRACS